MFRFVPELSFSASCLQQVLANPPQAEYFPATLWIDLSGNFSERERIETAQGIRREIKARCTLNVRLIVPAYDKTLASVSHAGFVYESISQTISAARDKNLPVFLTVLTGDFDHDRKNLLVAMMSEIHQEQSSTTHALYECSGEIKTWDHARFLRSCSAGLAVKVLSQKIEEEYDLSSLPVSLRNWGQTPSARVEELSTAWVKAASTEMRRTDVTATLRTLINHFGTGQRSSFNRITEQFNPEQVFARLADFATNSEQRGNAIHAIPDPPRSFFPELSLPPMVLVEELQQLRSYFQTCYHPTLEGLGSTLTTPNFEMEAPDSAEPLSTLFWTSKIASPAAAETESAIQSETMPLSFTEVHAAIIGMQGNLTELRASNQRRAIQHQAHRQLEHLRQRVENAVAAECSALAAREDIFRLHPTRYFEAYNRVYNSLLLQCLGLLPGVWSLRYFIFFHLPQSSLPSLNFHRRALYQSALGILLPIFRLLNRYRTLYGLAQSFRYFYREVTVNYEKLYELLPRLRQQTDHLRIELELQTQRSETLPKIEEITLATLQKRPAEYPQQEDIIDYLTANCLDPILDSINAMVHQSRQPRGTSKTIETEPYTCFVPRKYQNQEAWQCAATIVTELQQDSQITSAYDHCIGTHLKQGINYYSREERQLIGGPLECQVVLDWKRASLEQETFRPQYDILRASLDPENSAENLKFLIRWGLETGFLHMDGSYILVDSSFFPFTGNQVRIEFFQHRYGVTREALSNINHHSHTGLELACWFNWQMDHNSAAEEISPLSPEDIYDRMLDIPTPMGHSYYGNLKMENSNMLLENTYSPILMRLFAASDAATCKPRKFYRTHFENLLRAKPQHLKELLSLLLVHALRTNNNSLIDAVKIEGFIS